MKQLVLYVLLLLFPIIGYSQTISKTTAGFSIEMSDEEKAVKASSSMIKAKNDYRWTTNIVGLIEWEIKYIEDAKKYILYKSNVKFYESTTISGIKSRYASYLLGKEVKIQ